MCAEYYVQYWWVNQSVFEILRKQLQIIHEYEVVQQTLPVTPFRQGFGVNYKIIIDIIIIIIIIIITIIVLISLSAGQILIPYFLEISTNLRLLSWSHEWHESNTSDWFGK